MCLLNGNAKPGNNTSNTFSALASSFTNNISFSIRFKMDYLIYRLSTSLKLTTWYIQGITHSATIYSATIYSYDSLSRLKLFTLASNKRLWDCTDLFELRAYTDGMAIGIFYTVYGIYLDKHLWGCRKCTILYTSGHSYTCAY